jgi:hypothetical protein
MLDQKMALFRPHDQSLNRKCCDNYGFMWIEDVLQKNLDKIEIY